MTRVAVAVEGWNAEAAIGFALAARRFASAVTLSAGTETVDGKDDIEVLTLGPEPGEEIVLTVKGDDEKEAFSTLLARLLSAIERPAPDRSLTLEPGASRRRGMLRERTPSTSRRLCDREVVVLDTIEEVAPVLPRRKEQGTPRRKPGRKAGRKLTTTRRKPRKHRK